MALLRVIRILVLGLAAVLSGQGAGLAASSPWQGDEIMQARLITATDAVGDASRIDAGLEFKLAPGWKVYWRSPGDAGLPPVLDFSASPAIIHHELAFPAPTRFSILGFDSFGYSDHVILPLTLELAAPGRGFAASALLDGLVCSDVCIPVRETLTLALPAGPAAASPEARQMAEFKARVPGPGTAAGVVLAAAAIRGDNLLVRLERDGRPLALRQGDILIEAPSGFSFARPRPGQESSFLKMGGRPAGELIGQEVIVTVIAPDFLLEAAATVGEAGAIMPSNLGSVWAMLLIAFLGGVILNAMPCVLPVLSLKLASVISHGGEDRRRIRRSFLATAAGVISSFLLLGLCLFALRGAGVAIGWGIQFQQPAFLVLAALAIGFFGLVMLDLAVLPVPGFVQRMGRGLPSGLTGDFLSGALATLLATPCSAPFVGTAVAFALTAPGEVLLLVFVLMGAGLALPWMLVAGWPALVAFLPRPGPWLRVMKRVLAAGLFATMIWLLSVLMTNLSGTASADGTWLDWALGRAEEESLRGRVVFVDVTADWCLTCQTNKAFVISTDQVQAVFDEAEVMLLRADWTRPNEDISQFLASFGRYGIPFNIVYGPAAPEGIILGEILTTPMVLEAVARAQGD